MIKTNYYIISAISILCLIAGLLHLKENELLKRKQINRFQVLAYFIIADIVVDTAFMVLQGNPEISRKVLYLLKALELSMNCVIPLFILNLFVNHSRNKEAIQKIRIVLFILMIINAILQAISLLFGHFMFYLDENNMYQRNPATYGYAISFLFCLALLLWAISIFSRSIQNQNRLTILGFCVVFVTGFILTIFFKDTNFDWLCMSISIVFIIIYYTNAVLKIDPLTRLLNRQVYTRLIERINFTTLIIMIDANDFKKINDTYGHECGDRTLKFFAKSILKAYREYGYCFRIGGDEFCVILKPGVFKKLIEETPNCDVYVMAENLMGRLDEIIKAQCDNDNDNDSPMQYGVSQGYGIYYLPSEYPSIEEIMPLKKVIKLADMRMYQKKKEYKLSNSQASIEEELEQNKRPKVFYDFKDPELIENSDQE